MAVVSDSVETNAALAKRLGVEFPILSDADLTTIRAYGVEQMGKDIALPATFVISREGNITYSHIGDNPRDRPSIDDVLGAL